MIELGDRQRLLAQARDRTVVDRVDLRRGAAELRALGTPVAEFCIDIQRVVAEFCATETKLSGFDLPDPIAMSYAIDPTVATETRDLHLRVETDSELTRGMVVMDLLDLTGATPNATVITNADAAKFLQMLRAALG